MRINRYLAMCGIGSRRSVEEYIQSGRIKVNGEVCTDLATDIAALKDTVTFDNKLIKPIDEKIYLLLNKPKGFIVTRKDEFERKTVYDLIPEEWKHLFPIGRLDRDSEGLLLMTNDGIFAQKIIHPSFELEKVYRVEITGRLKKNDLLELRKGVMIDGRKTFPARIYIKSYDQNSTVLRITISEGRNRQIRKMLEIFGYGIVSLKRLQIGEIKIDRVPTGMFRLLKPSEVTSIMTMGKHAKVNRREEQTAKRKKE